MADNYTMSGGDIYGGSLPFSMEAEQSVLGAAVIDPGKIPDIMEDMKPEYFYRRQHSELYAMLVRMFSVGATIDVITILDNVRKEGIFDTPEDAKIYLAQLAQVVPTTANVASYAKIVREKYYLRSLILASREIVDNASDAQADADELLNLAEQKIYDIRQGRDTGNIVPISKVLVETYDHLQKISGE
ncbi:MAG: DnaB-like helicase N-terminal domain-containing protein, partial [Angelakisella sp.]